MSFKWVQTERRSSRGLYTGHAPFANDLDQILLRRARELLKRRPAAIYKHVTSTTIIGLPHRAIGKTDYDRACDSVASPFYTLIIFITQSNLAHRYRLSIDLVGKRKNKNNSNEIATAKERASAGGAIYRHGFFVSSTRVPRE